MNRMATCWLAIIFVLGATNAASDDFRIWPHLQNVSKTGATLIWETLEAGRGTVRYGPKDGALDHGAEEAQPATIHRLRLDGLEPDSAYTYRVEVDGHIQEATFSTAPAGDREIVFIVVGDSRRWGKRWQETGMDEHVKQWNAELFLTMGDLVLDGHQYEQWPEHFERFRELTGSKWFVTARGNHEGSQIRDTDNDWFAKYHELPGGEPYVSFDWGNTHFVLISYESTGRERDWIKSAKWLDAHLDTVDKRYTVVAQHYPVYCTGYYSTDLSRKEPGVRATAFREVLDKHNVTLECSGHTHIYERHYPLKANRRDDRNGTYYVVNGGGINANYPDWWTAVADDRATMAKPTYSVFFAKRDRLECRTFAWSVPEERIAQIDHFVIWKDEAIPRGVLNGLGQKTGAELVEAIEMLGAMLYAPAAEALLPYINHDDAAVRYAAAKSISLIANEDVAGAVFDLLRDDDSRIAAYMARALEVALPKRLLKKVQNLIVDRSVPEPVRVHLIGALQFHAPPRRTTKAMIDLLGGEAAQGDIRKRAVYALGQTATIGDAKELTALVEHETDPYVLMTLAWHLNHLTRNRVSLSSTGPLATSAPGERQEFIKKWLSD